MGANGYFGDIWLGKVRDDLAQNSVIPQKSEIRADHTEKDSTNPISRDRFGSIDYKYYATRSRTLRSDAVVSFFKVMMTRLKIH
ncbi:hypothetical protein [Desulfopila aestuarii]|uniref:Uncharacterized protein n=1 Tax=Desulfopila aestuarii DSM 18488 TaxID=1121416 RepID=A0A1M7XY42_9BACT|nr:hypothetical protein [Desulfopila aestuarii]SHO43897.1 hypothetical protein SAMN02745220_00562 [Desulfopila aestuarii DSM 18488]